MNMLHGPQAKKKGIVYLQDQEYKFQAKKDGRFWSVYGSPVCSSRLRIYSGMS